MSDRFLLLGGRVAMPAELVGDRPAIDAVLLAAAAPAGPEDRVLDAGCGSGAVALCLAARSPCAITAIDVEPRLVEAAQAAIALNERASQVTATAADLESFRAAEPFDLVLSNPPYHPGAGTPSDDRLRALARMDRLSLASWLRHCLRVVRPRGRLVTILRADRLPEALAALVDRAGDLHILPVQPRADAPAHRVLLGARKAVRTPATLLPPLVLHEADGGWTAAAQAILADATPIDWLKGKTAA